MTPLQLRPSTLDEIIFEGRNKAYGAFDLRQSYPTHLRRALTIATLLFAVVAGAPIATRLLWPAQPAPTTNPITDVVISDVVFQQPKPAKPEVAQPVARGPKTPTIAVPTRVVPNDQAKPQTPSLEEPVDALPSTVTSMGDPNSVVDPDGALGDPKAGSETGTGTLPVEAPAKPEEVFKYAEKMPEFIGGSEAMVQFLRRNMHYPARALREGVEGKVFVAFTVSSTGDIVDVEVIKGLGYGTDEEAARVVKMMPRWQAGAQNGRPVAVRYTLPITFKSAQ